ncbi:MAG TPA: hypothetical protein VFI64_00550 [Nitrososphaeraceae archaeon]|nr:hypothetical protein [Nitrososphaeraceae archaeon]
MLHSAAQMKANWSCTACGMYSGRRYCVQRHIDNIHKGKANAIPFIEYLVGRREGLYPPNARPSYGSQKQRTLVEKAEDEFVSMLAHRAAESITPAVGDPAYRAVSQGVLNNINARQSLLHLGELLEQVKFFQNKSRPNVPAAHGTTSKGDTEYDLLHKDDLLPLRRPNILQDNP